MNRTKKLMTLLLAVIASMSASTQLSIGYRF